MKGNYFRQEKPSAGPNPAEGAIQRANDRSESRTTPKPAVALGLDGQTRPHQVARNPKGAVPTAAELDPTSKC
jgi:hypothetical protein